MLNKLSTAFLITGVVAGGASLGLLASVGSGNLRLNPSQSMPRGLYIIDRTAPITRGSTIFMTLPPVMRDYVSTFPGALQMYDKAENGFLKPVVGVAGDVICRTANDAFIVNGVSLGMALRFGPSGAALPVWRGCHTLASDELAVFSDHIADSTDSRYFGAIKSNTAIVARPFLVEKVLHNRT